MTNIRDIANRVHRLVLATTIAGGLALLGAQAGAVTITHSFSMGPVAAPVAISRDPVSGNVYVFANDALGQPRRNIEIRTELGALMGPGIPHPGNQSNDFGLDFIGVSIPDLGGSTVPANNLLVFNGDDNPETVYAVNPGDGSVLATLALPVGLSSVGGAYHEGRETLFTVDFVGADLVREFDPATGTQQGSFAMNDGTPDAFDVAFGAIDVDPLTGNLFVVGSSQEIIRVMTPEGAFVRDIDLTGLAGFDCRMSGLHIDHPDESVWVTCVGGTQTDVFRLGDLDEPVNAVPLPAAAWLLGSGLLGLAGIGLARRRTGNG